MLKKLNRGALLFAGAILCIVIYLIVLSIGRSAEKPAQSKLVEDYTQAYVAALAGAKDIEEAEIPAYVEGAMQKLSAYLSKNDYVRRGVKTVLTNEIENIRKNNTVLPARVSFAPLKYSYVENYVQVSCYYRVETQNSRFEKGSAESEVVDSFFLIKEEEQWKITSARVTFSENDGGIQYPGRIY